MRDPIARLNAALEGRYEIVREIGEGGMATVYLADDLRHERKVALKVLKPELAAVVGAERFLAEIKTTANLQHPHILPLFDSGEADGFLFYVMPYIDGETLRDRLDREKQLPVDEAIGIASAVAAALQTAHDAGVVHRDIKPGNVLMSQGEPLVSDFGIALAVGAAGGPRLTETGLSVGTPYYMSPEQATGDRVIGPPSDVYSLACVLYEMLVGEPPYTGPTAQAVLGRIIMGTPVSATAVRASIPRNVDAAIRKSLEKLPADRFPSAQAFAKALGDPSFRYGADAEAAGSRGAVSAVWRWAAIGAAAVAVLTVVALLREWNRPGPAAGPVVRGYVDVGDLVISPLDEIAVSPDGSRLAAAGVVDGERHLYLRNSDEERFRLVPGTENAGQPTFSPQGDWVAYVDVESQVLKRVSVSGGAPRTIGGEEAFQPHWGVDGMIVFQGLSGAGEGIHRVPETGGEAELILEGEYWINPRLLPGGRALIATHSLLFSTVFLELGVDSVRTLVPDGVDASYVETGHLLYVDRSGSLWAVGFDPADGVIEDEPIRLLDGVTLNLDRYARYAVSRNGTLVYGAGGAVGNVGLNSLVVSDLEGRRTVPPLEPRNFGDFQWSPDGASVVWSHYEGLEEHLYVYDVEIGSTPTPLTAEGRNFNPVWSPDGRRIAFASQRAGIGDVDLFVKTVGDASPPTPILTRPGWQSPEDWPTDDVLVFEDRPGQTTDLWVIDPADSASARPYLTAEADLRDAAVSPDGTLLAYVSNETGEWEVYVRSFPAAGQPISVSHGSGLTPRWAPDGSTIYYWSARPSVEDSLIAARVQRTPTFAVLSTEPVLTGDYAAGSWDLHPDGDRFAVAVPAGAGGQGEREPERFLIVTNWFAELRAALGGSRDASARRR